MVSITQKSFESAAWSGVPKLSFPAVDAAGVSFVRYPAADRQPCKLEFQGALVKLSFPSSGFVRDDDNARFERCFAKEMFAAARDIKDKEGNLIKAREIPERDVVRVGGRLVGAEISPTMRRILSERALNRLQSMKRGLRGQITGFSRRSRGRLIERLARLRTDVEALFLTFTYRENMTDYAKSAAHLVKVVDWLEYHYPGCAAVWRKELQGRGAVHYHVLLFGVDFVDIAALTEYWQRITADKSYPDVKRLRGLRQVLGYVSKYLAKVADGASLSEANGLIDAPYSGKASSTGRWWGMFGRANLPFAELKAVTFSGRLYPVVQFRRAASRKSAAVRRPGRLQGFKLFSDGVDEWLRYWDYLCKSEPSLL